MVRFLDTARAAAAELLLPLINCPTVASSDAPCSALSVVYTDAGAFEAYRIYRRNPDLVLVDTQVIAAAPARLLVAGMGDALATWFEAKTCANGRVRDMRGGASTESALALAELCYRTLLADGADALSAVETQVVTPALDRIVEANTLLSGLGFESSGLAAAHAVHNGLTAVAQTHPYFHGEKVAFGVLVQLILEGKSHALLSEVMEFAAGVGLPIRLADIGLAEVSRDAIERIADRTTVPGETIHNEPFDVESRMVVDAIRAADSAGRAWYNRHHSSTTGNATAKHDKSEATHVGTSGARSATAVPSLSSGATEEQMNARGTVPQRIDKRGSKVDDLAGTGQQDAPGG